MDRLYEARVARRKRRAIINERRLMNSLLVENVNPNLGNSTTLIAQHGPSLQNHVGIYHQNNMKNSGVVVSPTLRNEQRRRRGNLHNMNIHLAENSSTAATTNRRSQRPLCEYPVPNVPMVSSMTSPLSQPTSMLSQLSSSRNMFLNVVDTRNGNPIGHDHNSDRVGSYSRGARNASNVPLVRPDSQLIDVPIQDCTTISTLTSNLCSGNRGQTQSDYRSLSPLCVGDNHGIRMPGQSQRNVSRRRRPLSEVGLTDVPIFDDNTINRSTSISNEAAATPSPTSGMRYIWDSLRSNLLPTQQASPISTRNLFKKQRSSSSSIFSRTVVNNDGSYKSTISVGEHISNIENLTPQSTNNGTGGLLNALPSNPNISGHEPYRTPTRENPYMDLIEGDLEVDDDHSQTCDTETVPEHEAREDVSSASNVDKRRSRGRFESVEYWSCGEASYSCQHCGAIVWFGERAEKKKNLRNPEFSICCGKGKVQLPRLKEPPPLLQRLLDYLGGARSIKFREKIKIINALFAFTSMGGDPRHGLNNGGGPYVFRLSSQNHHLIGSLLPESNHALTYAQMYIYEGNDEFQVRMDALMKEGCGDNELKDIVKDLITMLDECNPYVKVFRMARERFRDESLRPVRLRLIGSRNNDGRQHNLPTVAEVAAIIPGDGESTDHRDVIIEERSGRLRRITELHPSFMALQYPILFPYGEDGFRLKIPLNVPPRKTGRKYVSMREYYCYRHFQRADQPNTLQKGGRLYHTYSVDSYTCVEENNLRFVRNNQKRLRCEVYRGLHDRLVAGDADKTSIGKRFILPSSFVGSPRYMVQNYQDAMAICRWAGPPDLFITMTCNPKWPEIDAEAARIPGQKGVDRHELADRIFKQKLDKMMDDFKEGEYFGRLKAAIYTIEFQKRGLPHAHILLFLQREDKITSPADIDEVISAELPCPLTDPVGFEAVRQHMIHGPCGTMNPKSPCMHNGECEKGYEKKFIQETSITDDGWPIYRRRNNGRIASVRNDKYVVDNRWVVPHNVHLLIKYNCHINVEWCNQGTLIKYLFKYLNKGHDRATILIGENVNTPSDIGAIMRVEDEIKHFQDSRYISASEASWRLFGFPTQYRSIGVERLAFHLEGENSICFDDEETVADILDRTTAAMTQFTKWFEANQKYSFAKTLTYEQFPTHFTWHGDKRKLYWEPRKTKQKVIGRLYYVPPATGELFYLRATTLKCCVGS